MVVKVKAQRRPVGYGYVRVSTREQVERGHSLEAQQAECERYFGYKLKDQAMWGGTFVDRETKHGKKGVSGRTRFRDRKAGGELWERLKPGDHVLVTDLSRAFRSFRDAIASLEQWHEEGVTVHFCRDGFATDSAMGRTFIRFMAIFVAWERDMVSERTREVMRRRKREGKTVGGVPTVGRRYEGIAGHRRLVDDEKEVQLCLDVVKYHDGQGMTFDEIYWSFQKANLRTREGKPWSRNRIYRAYLEGLKRLSGGSPSSPTRDGSPS